jgi:diguanylate cyclase (GGDEF)-like protein/PAS domain S-box-containing protein
MYRDTARVQRNQLARHLLPLGYAGLGLVGLILAMTWGALQVQVTLAGFLNGESTWSKAQKQAVIDLDAYAADGAPTTLADFRRNYRILISDAHARDAIASGHFDRKRVAQAFRRGEVIPKAIPGMIFILEYFPTAPHMREALHAWYSVNRPIAELGRIADNLSHRRASLSDADIARVRQRIRTLNRFIAPRANEFSVQIAQGAAWVGEILFIGVLVAAAIALMLWLLMARRTLARIRGSEERYRLLFDSAPDAIVMVDDESGRILDANHTARAWTRRNTRELIGASYADLYEQVATPEAPSGSGELRGDDDSPRSVETQSSMTRWGERVVRQTIIRDVSERVKRNRERRVAAEALASITEGVIIADAARCVISANAAATQITGYTAEDLTGMRLEDSRLMPDGDPLPATIWDEIAVLRHWSGEVRGRRKDGSTYVEQLAISTIRGPEQRILHYVAVFSDISVAKTARRRLQHLAAHDPLTDLANRAEFERHCEAAIERAERNCRAAVVLFIDLDGFKFVNDSYSHAMGDSLLKLVADRMRREVREDGVVGRIGGDEFTVLLPGFMLREDATLLAGRLVSVLSEPFYVDDFEIVLSASIGIAGFPLDGDDAQTLIGKADTAMYAAKREERNTWRFYVPRMQADTRQRLQLAAELRKALLNDEFRIVYQPSVEMRSGRIVAVEALLRWQHPERGKVMPDEFIPIAESIGMIHRIDDWVMRSVCAQIHIWDKLGMPNIRVAVNVSARWFGHCGFAESVRRTLQTHDVAADRIVLEVTEGAMLRLGEETERTMQALHELGVGVAVDDFGTGYSSMAYLKLPAVAYLKIDRSFVTDLPDDANDVAIVTATLAMAGSLGLTTIAEGIETEAQHDFLLQAGCLEGQGYLYSYPLPAAAIEGLLPKRQPAGGAKLKLVPRVRG